MNTESINEFLKKAPPFQFLADSDLIDICKNITIQDYTKGTNILKQNGPASDSLRIVIKGGVKVSLRSPEGQDLIVDYRGEGDSFGLWSIIEGGTQKTTVVAIEDTTCCLLDKNRILSLLDTNAVFTEYFLKSHISKYMDKVLMEMNSSRLLGGSDRILYTTQVGEINSRDIVTVEKSSSIFNTAQTMASNRISSVIVVDKDGLPEGIVTDRDMREKVVAKAEDINKPISTIMSLPLIRVDAKDYCYEAVLKMIRHKIHHLLVIKEGKLSGMITNHDLMILQGKSPICIAQEIEDQQTVEGLAPISKRINNLIGMLLKEGAKAVNITTIISEINDSLVTRILEIAEKKFGKPPLPYCWIVYGSEGRKEQTFRTDQDNAIIYADPKNQAEAKAAEEYFEKFAEFVKNSLLQCGFSLCTGNYMASNPKWRQPLSVWKRYFTDWITTPKSEAILASVILFDFRPVYGDISLGDSLKTHLLNSLKNQDMFFLQMARMTVNVRPPLGFFKTFVVEKSGEHKNQLNLKFKIIAPLLNIARLYSLEKQIPETSTIERIEKLKGIHNVIKEFGDELQYAFEFIMLLRIHHQVAQIETGAQPDNFINPDKLSNLERMTLKQICQLITKVQDIINSHYMLGRLI
ncbi:MAG: cyclic nucleotide-binding/CBS domain-containing protein [Nitrospirae bacterium]|nr:cyclic nucleotide-binding/CBS domain-containing protein [Nitrospirota bacterium]